MERAYYIYILRCKGGRLYTGYTSDPVRRFNQHKTGKGGAKFTSGFKPVSVAALWQTDSSKGDAMKIEALLKSLKREQKESVIDKPALLPELISERLPDISVNVSALEIDFTFDNK